MIDVVIIETQRDIREGLERLLEGTNDIHCQAAFASGQEALRALDLLQPDVVILDMSIADISCISCIREMRQLLPQLNILILVEDLSDDFLFELLSAGAFGLIEKDFFPSTVITAIHEIHEGGAPMSKELARRVVAYFSESRTVNQSLSKRERSVYQLLCEGHSTQEIAQRLHVSHNTIRFHIKNIYKKLGVNSRYEALSKAYRWEGQASSRAKD